MRVLWVGVVLVLASACGRSAGNPPPVPDSPCDARFDKGEFASNYAMTATLSRAPAVGETAELTVATCAKEGTRTAVTVVLPDRVEWRTPPAGTVPSSRPGPYGGCDDVATGEWDLTAMTPFEVTGTVVATKTGPADLTGSASAVAPSPMLPGNAAHVYITVGDDRTLSYFGYPEYDGDAASTSATQRPVPVCD
jgi:hypothetical protein